uniref:Uncharacterized protein n=1 Tax=Pyricularia oryzae (strain P131) TaxID=1143193 RepID=L7IT45_PYRO1
MGGHVGVEDIGAMTVAQPGFGMRARNLDWTVIDLTGISVPVMGVGSKLHGREVVHCRGLRGKADANCHRRPYLTLWCGRAGLTSRIATEAKYLINSISGTTGGELNSGVARNKRHGSANISAPSSIGHVTRSR